MSKHLSICFNRLFTKKTLQNERGMSLVEVMVAAGLASIISLGIARMMQSSMEEQKKSRLMQTLVELKARQETLIRDPQSWSQTLGDTTNNTGAFWDGLRGNCNPAATPAAPCNTTALAYTTPQKIVLSNGAGQVIFNLLDWAGTGTNGFTETGAACTGFVNPATPGTPTGTDACPISYILVYAATCPAGTGPTCGNPTLTITSRLRFNPSANGTLAKFSMLIDQRTTASIQEGQTPSNHGRYDVVINRSANKVSRSFVIAYQFQGAPGGECITGGAGACNQSLTTFATYPAFTNPASGGTTRGWRAVEHSDDYNLVTTTLTSSSFTILEAGTYKCSITAPTFSTQGFSATLYDVAANTTIGSGANYFAPMYQGGTARTEINFNSSTANRVYQIRQRCRMLPQNDPTYDGSVDDVNLNQCSLGMTGGYQVYEDLVVISCLRTDAALTDN